MESPLKRTISEHLDIFRRGAIDLVELGELEKALGKAFEERRPLRIKLGMDPSSPDLHLGHAVLLRKLRALQEVGHQIVLIVGDATAMVGDPSGRNQLRPQLSREEVEANLETYTDQAGQVLDLDRTEILRNATWFDALDFEGLLKLGARMTVARMIERDTFQQRMEAREPVGIHELFYPLLQGWDSVEVRADVELGGSDQLFNLLVGRDLQRQEGQRPQICLTTPLITGLDGRKMSKSYGNAIGLTDSSREMFGKIMSLPDEVMGTWFELLTDLQPEESAGVLAGHPREAKARLGREICAFFFGQGEAEQAARAFDQQFREGKLPEDIPLFDYREDWRAEGIPLAVLLRELGLATSTQEARRLVQQGAVRLDGERASEPMLSIGPPAQELLIKVGKRRFARLRGEA